MEIKQKLREKPDARLIDFADTFYRLDDILYTPDDAIAELIYAGYSQDEANEYLSSLDTENFNGCK